MKKESWQAVWRAAAVHTGYEVCRCPKRRLLHLVVVIAILTSGCAGSAASLDDADNSSAEPASTAIPLPTETASEPKEPTPLPTETAPEPEEPTPLPTETAPESENLNPAPVPSADGPTPLTTEYFGPLEPGTYSSDKLEVPLIVDVPAGWSIALHNLWFMAFAAPESTGPGDHGVVLAVPTSFGADDLQLTGSVGESFEAWLQEAPSTVSQSEVNEVTLANRSARIVDLAVTDDSECIEGDAFRCILVYRAGAFGKWLSTDTAFRAIWFADETPVLIIMATPQDDAVWLDFAEDLVRNMTFGDA